MSNVTLSELPRSAARSGVIDFHNHHVPERFELTAAKAAPPNQRARWEAAQIMWLLAATGRSPAKSRFVAC